MIVGKPLAERRPQTLTRHRAGVIICEGELLRRIALRMQVSSVSLILWVRPGTENDVGADYCASKPKWSLLNEVASKVQAEKDVLSRLLSTPAKIGILGLRDNSIR